MHFVMPAAITIHLHGFTLVLHLTLQLLTGLICREVRSRMASMVRWSGWLVVRSRRSGGGGPACKSLPSVLCVGLPAIFHPFPNIFPVPIFPNYF